MAITGNRPPRRRAGEEAELAEAVWHHRAGRLREAASGYRRVLAKTPGEPDALHLLGVMAISEGDPEHAIRLIRRAIIALPNFAEAHSNLGNALRAAARTEEACDSYRRAVALDPNCAPAHANLARLLCEKGEFAAALVSCRRAVALTPTRAEAHDILGTALRALGQFEAAEGAFRRALQLEPSAARYTNIGNLLTDRGRNDDAERSYRHGIEFEPGFALAHHGLATQLHRRGEIAAAIASYRTATRLDPGRAAVWDHLGVALRTLGRIQEAVEAFRRALAVDPDFAEAYRQLADCGGLPADGTQAARAAALAACGERPLEERAAAGFALGRALDDAGRFDEAFTAYEQANRLYLEWRRALGERFDGMALHRQIEDTIGTFTPANFRILADWGNPSELPVFIVGMPRSGTSLVEQIAASHSQVFGAGELGDIGALTGEIARAMAAGDRALARRRADAHLDRLRRIGGDALRVIDKLPDNLFLLGVIATLFPNARIVFCQRDPRDVCLSCYFQKFAGGQLLFSYDLMDCARRLIETERLAAHWARALPLRRHDVRYEDLVADLEGESRRLITFLGLAWEPGCLDFHRAERVVTTASAWQVRQPLYDRSVGRWRHYRRHLGPLVQALAAAELPNPDHGGPAARAGPEGGADPDPWYVGWTC
jgi:tetratricopeptide (TPR) repeat protein